MVASMRQQYGLRINSEEFREMPWDEFADLLSGLNDRTSLVTVARIRTETDPEMVKNLTPEQRRIRSEWQRKRAMRRPEAETQAFLDQMQEGIAQLFGRA